MGGRDYGEGLALSASFGGGEGMALLDMISRVTDKVTVLTIDTGFIFKETAEFREEVMRRYKLPVEVLKPELTIEEQVECYGEQMRTCTPNLCCQIRRSNRPEGPEPLRRLDDGIRREQTPRGRHAGHRLGGALPGRQDSAACTGRRAGVGLREGARRARQPAAAPGLQEHRLRAADEAGAPRRGPQGRPVGRAGQDGVRHPLRRRQVWAGA